MAVNDESARSQTSNASNASARASNHHTEGLILDHQKLESPDNITPLTPSTVNSAKTPPDARDLRNDSVTVPVPVPEKLDHIQQIPRLMTQFHIYCENEHSSENLECRDQIKALFEKIKSECVLLENKQIKEEEILKKFQDDFDAIFKVFFSEQATKPVLLSAETLRKIQEEKKRFDLVRNGFTKQSFQAALPEIELVLEKDPLRRFVKSPTCNKISIENQTIDKLILKLKTYLSANSKDEFPSGCGGCCKVDKHSIFMNFKNLKKILDAFKKEDNLDITPVVTAIRVALREFRTLIGDKQALERSKNEYTIALYQAFEALTQVPASLEPASHASAPASLVPSPHIRSQLAPAPLVPSPHVRAQPAPAPRVPSLHIHAQPAPAPLAPAPLAQTPLAPTSFSRATSLHTGKSSTKLIVVAPPKQRPEAPPTLRHDATPTLRPEAAPPPHVDPKTRGSKVRLTL